MESVHDISEVFLTYDDKKDINAHLCLIDVVELYSNYLAVHLSTSKEIILEEYKKSTNLSKFPVPALLSPW